MKNITLDQVQENIFNKVYQNKMEFPSIKKVSPTHIFDKSLSVLENEKMALEHNEKVKSEKAKYYNETERLNELFRQDTISGIANTTSLNEKQAKHIFNYAYTQYHSCGMYEILSNIHELVELVEKCIE